MAQSGGSLPGCRICRIRPVRLVRLVQSISAGFSGCFPVFLLQTAADLLQAGREYLMKGSVFQLRRRCLQNAVGKLRIHPELQPQPFFPHDRHSLRTALISPVVLVGKIFLFQSAGCKLAVGPPWRTLFKNPAQFILVR